MVLLFYITYISVDLAHQVIFHAKVGKGGIKMHTRQNLCTLKTIEPVNGKLFSTTPSDILLSTCTRASEGIQLYRIPWYIECRCIWI